VELARKLAVGKGRIERPVEVVLAPRAAEQSAAPEFKSADDLASWQALVEDTRLNETARRLLIHEHLARSGVVAPEKVCKWLYKEVLHADLDDPYLGLGKVLLDGDPFRRAEKAP
jgi:hypothetical protein